MLSLQKIRNIMILNLEFKNFRSFKGVVLLRQSRHLQEQNLTTSVKSLPVLKERNGS